MGIVQFILDVYFAAVLGIAGLAKLDRPRFFLSTLHYRYHFPVWNARIIGNVFPYFELLLSLSLFITTNVVKSIAAFAILTLFIIFFTLQIVEYITKTASDDCGCYGKALRRSGIQTNIMTLFIQLFLAACLVLLTLSFAPLPRFYYLGGAALFAVIYGWLGWNSWKRRHSVLRARLLSTS